MARVISEIKNYDDLYSNEALFKIDQEFLFYLKDRNKEIYNLLLTRRKNLSNNHFTSQEIIDLSVIQQEYLVSKFAIFNEFNKLKKYSLYLKDLYEFKRNFIHRNALIKYKESHFSKDFKYFSNFANDFEKKYINNLNHNNLDYNFFEIVKFWSENSNKYAQEILDAEIYSSYRVYFKSSELFSYPKKLDFTNLIGFNRKNDDFNSVYKNYENIRDGIKYKHDKKIGDFAHLESNYCINCHQTSKDSCKDGLFKNGVIQENTLKNQLKGCPLEQKISEMNFLAKNGDLIAALSVIVIDNPIVALTGYRICNDCSKSCIFQKQEPVDIPSIETMIFEKIIKLPFGFEIYSLLIRWNIFDNINFIPKEKINKEVLIVGLGPSGIALSHYLSNLGINICAIDALNVKNLPSELSNNLIKDYDLIEEYYEKLKPLNFGGVAEYGITERWSKVNLLILMIILVRRKLFKFFGSVRFGSNINIDHAVNLFQFDHIAFCAGSGKPFIPDIKNIDAGNIRTASDFLMALHIGALDKYNSPMNFHVRIPAYIIGGGLTAIDSACEFLAYYPIFIKKYGKLILDRKINIQELTTYEQEIYEEILAHYNEFLQEDNIAKLENRDVDYLKIINKFGGVNLIYRADILQSPSYRINHEEIKSALAQGVNFIDNCQIDNFEKDKNGNIEKILLQKNDQIIEKQAKFILMATGTSPLELKDIDQKLINIDPKLLNNITILGDMDRDYHGSVVKALASVKNKYKNIYNKLLELKNRKFESNSKADFSDLIYSKIVGKRKISEGFYEILIKSKLIASTIKPGQYIKFQDKNYNFESIPLSAFVIDDIDYYKDFIEDENSDIDINLKLQIEKIKFIQGLFASKKISKFNIFSADLRAKDLKNINISFGKKYNTEELIGIKTTYHLMDSYLAKNSETAFGNGASLEEVKVRVAGNRVSLNDEGVIRFAEDCGGLNDGGVIRFAEDCGGLNDGGVISFAGNGVSLNDGGVISFAGDGRSLNGGGVIRFAGDGRSLNDWVWDRVKFNSYILKNSDFSFRYTVEDRFNRCHTLGVISVIITPKGAATRKILSLEIGDEVKIMGPLGKNLPI